MFAVLTVLSLLPATLVGLVVFGFALYCVWPRLFPGVEDNPPEPTGDPTPEEWRQYWADTRDGGPVNKPSYNNVFEGR